MAAVIPVVDLLSKETIVIEQLHNAFSSIGFVFVSNHGLSQEQIAKMFAVTGDFFGLNHSVKMRVARSDKTCNNGYVPMETESLDPSQPGDLKECYNSTGRDNKMWPEGTLDHFKPIITEFYSSCKDLVLKLLLYMGKSLQLEDPEYFAKNHGKMGHGRENFTTLRLLHYPPIKYKDKVKSGQLRCGEHVDYGSITLLFQQPIGGLQVKRTGGTYINVPYVEGAVLVNLGALMQRWTGDIYQATPHRVLIPEEDIVREKSRFSLAFFAHPDNDCVVMTVDGSSKYPPIKAEDDLRERFQRSYGYTY